MQQIQNHHALHFEHKYQELSEEAATGGSLKQGVIKSIAKFTVKHLRQNLFFHKVAELRPATIIKNRLWHSFFPVSFAKFSKTPFKQSASRRLLLKVRTYMKNVEVK